MVCSIESWCPLFQAPFRLILTRTWQIELPSFCFYLFSDYLVSRLQINDGYRNVLFTYNRQDFEEKKCAGYQKYYDTHNNGDIMSRMVNDMDKAAEPSSKALI